MDISKLPIWAAYFIAPAIVLLSASASVLVARKFNGPLDWSLELVIFAVGAGVLCAAVLHAYVALKRRVMQRLAK